METGCGVRSNPINGGVGHPPADIAMAGCIFTVTYLYLIFLS